MSEKAISVENLSKKYILGKAGGSEGLRHVIHDFATAPLRWFKKPAAAESSAPGRESLDEFWALREVSFDIKQGEVVGVIGRNGAGKSTILKILSRITEQTTGRVEINGRVSSLLEVGTGFHPELTGRENIFLNGAILGMTRQEIRSKFDEIVAFAEVERFLETPVKRYSSGMYVRLAFAVAAHLEPEILIVDEVLAVGDAQFQKKCLGKMQDVSRDGRTVLFVSHNLEAVRKLCNKGVLLERGRLVAAGPIEGILTRYVNSDRSLKTHFPISPPKMEDAPARALEVVTEAADGAPFNGFPVGKPWNIRVRFTVERPTKHFILGVGLNSERSIPIWTAWSQPLDLEPGNYEAAFLNDQVSLSTGSYSIVVGLSSQNRTFHQTEEARLVIAEVSEDSNAIVVDGSCGFIINPMSVVVSKTTPGGVQVLARNRVD